MMLVVPIPDLPSLFPDLPSLFPDPQSLFPNSERLYVDAILASSRLVPGFVRGTVWLQCVTRRIAEFGDEHGQSGVLRRDGSAQLVSGGGARRCLSSIHGRNL